MKWIGLAAAVAIVMAGAAFAQPPDYSEEARTAMSKLGYLIGSWKGTAVVQAGPGQATEVTQTEVVESRLDGLVLVVEGLGKAMKPGEPVVHHAVGLISYDVLARQYQVVAYRQDGQSVIATGKFLDDGNFQWGFELPGRQVRYHMGRLQGDWFETGEFSIDGKTWTTFIEMQLKRIK